MGMVQHGRLRRLPRWIFLTGLAVSILVGCERGEVAGTSSVSDISATLHGTVYSNDPLPRYWFEYDTAPTVVDGRLTYGFATRTGQQACCGPMLTASQQVTGLIPDTTYHYRFCIRTESETGLCGAPGTFRTKPANRDVVDGSVWIPIFPQLGSYEGVTVSVRAEPDGSEPVGRVSRLPGSWYFRYPDEGPSTCLRIVGSRATIGFVAADGGGGSDIPQVVFVEDNGPTGDRFAYRVVEETPLVCPDPDDESIVWRDATNGDITITDVAS